MSPHFVVYYSLRGLLEENIYRTYETVTGEYQPDLVKDMARSTL
jgi:hypothetical protein